MPPAISTALQATILALFQSQDPPLPYREIARRTKVSTRSVIKYLSPENQPKLIAKVGSTPSFAAIKKGIAEKFYRQTDTVLEAITPDKIDKMNAYQLAGMSGVLHQNARLASDQSTQNIGIAAVVAAATKERMEKSG